MRFVLTVLAVALLAGCAGPRQPASNPNQPGTAEFLMLMGGAMQQAAPAPAQFVAPPPQRTFCNRIGDTVNCITR